MPWVLVPPPLKEIVRKPSRTGWSLSLFIDDHLTVRTVIATATNLPPIWTVFLPLLSSGTDLLIAFCQDDVSIWQDMLQFFDSFFPVMSSLHIKFNCWYEILNGCEYKPFDFRRIRNKIFHVETMKQFPMSNKNRRCLNYIFNKLWWLNDSHK